jgi:hypothetical protein
MLLVLLFDSAPRVVRVKQAYFAKFLFSTSGIGHPPVPLVVVLTIVQDEACVGVIVYADKPEWECFGAAIFNSLTVREWKRFYAVQPLITKASRKWALFSRAFWRQCQWQREG